MANYTILVADYDPTTTKLATSAFEAAGFEVHIAKDGLNALEAFKKHRPVLTLIEFMMPKKAGLEVCRDLRHSPEGRDAHLVVMSSPFRGRAFRADAVRVYGATETVEKPLNEEKLLGLIERLVRPRVAELVATRAPQPAAPAAVPIDGAPHPTAAATAAPPASQEDATARALRDVVSSVLGSHARGELGAVPAAGNNGEAKPVAPQRSVADESAGEAEIEDHIDSLLDF